MVWRIEFEDAALKKLAKLDKPVARRILAFLRERMASLQDPRSVGKTLKGSRLGDFWKQALHNKSLAIEIKFVRCPEIVQDMPHISLQFLGSSAFHGHLRVLDLLPKLLDAVELSAIAWQKMQRHALRFQKRN